MQSGGGDVGGCSLCDRGLQPRRDLDYYYYYRYYYRCYYYRCSYGSYSHCSFSSYYYYYSYSFSCL